MTGKNDGEGAGLDRRRLLSLGGTAVAASALPLGAAGATGPGPATDATPSLDDPQQVTVVEGTNIATAVSPDGSRIAFDLFGVIWTVAAEGGPARRLTDDLTDGAQPDWTPDGKSVVFQSYRDGNFHVWRVGADGSGLTQLTKGPYDCREPRVSPDGKRIAFSSDRGGSYEIHVLELASGETRLWASAKGQACEPAWSPDGKRIAFAVNRSRIEIVDETGARTKGPAVSTSADRMNAVALSSPSFTPDGGDIAFAVVDGDAAELRTSRGVLVAGEDVFPFRPTWAPDGSLVYAADGKIRLRAPGDLTARDVAFSAVVPVVRPRYAKRRRDFDSTKPRPVVGIGAPALSPDGAAVAFRALNDIWILTIGGKARPLTRDGFYKVDPAWSPDGGTLAYSTDRGGKLDIWLRDLKTGEDRQLTRHDGAAISAAWSRDGKTIAFLDQTGALHLVEVATGKIRPLFGAIWEPGKPSWSADGATIALAAFKPYSARFREGLSEILTVSVATGEASYEPALPHRSIGTRGDDGPVWSPDGTRMAFVLGSRLWVGEVDPKGKLKGAPKPINEEVTDAPTWSGDGSKLLYLSAGRLRLIDAAGGAPKTVPHGLTWAAAKPRGRVIVRAAKLWDGEGPDTRRNIDILVEANRIVAVSPAAEPPAETDAKVVDARDATVIPGLTEIHAHRQMQGYGYGDRDGRLWLSLGVTTTRSPSSPAYHMVEDREAIDSGARVGPRYFATGEAIDGSRIFYNFMRPVTEPGQMELELERARALGYDLIKSYVRQPLAQQKAVTEWAHVQGIPVTSHYHYPALAFGLDGMEHMGATSRFGYSRTVSALGASYQDVTALFVRSGARRTPTLFTSMMLYGEDRSLVDDPRTRALYPPWEYARLLERVDQITAADTTAAKASLARNVAHLTAILRSGGRVVTGTDSPIDFNGISLHMNLRAMVKYGLTPFEALTTATRYAGEFLGEPLGVIRPGAYADLVVCEGDPLSRIEDAAAVRQVMKNGEVFDIASLTAPFASASQTVEAMTAPEPRPLKAAFWWHEADYVEGSRAACCADPFHLQAGRGRRRFVAEAV